MGGETLSRHAALGGQLVLWAALLTIAMVFWWALHTPLFADEIATLPPVARRSASTLAGAATLLLAAIATSSVVRIGHTGAEAVWGGMLCCK
jgi:hypothetical protein